MYDLIDRIRKSNNAYGAKSLKDTDLFLLKRQIAYDFDKNIDYESGVLVNDIPQRMWVSRVPNQITARKIKSYPDETFSRGDLIQCYGSNWLVTELDANKQVQTTGKMEQCNRELIWQDSDTLEIEKRWVIAKKPYTSNINKGVQISVSAREFEIQIQYDDQTSKLDLGKRFMLEIIDGKPKTYSITAVDQTTNRYDDGSRGFIILNVVQDQANCDTDNVELQVCDYIKPKEIEIIIPGFAAIKATDFSVKLGSGGYRTFTGKIFDNNSIEINDYSNIEFSWKIYASELQRNFLIIDFPSNDICKIKCNSSNRDDENDLLLFSKFELILSAKDLLSGFDYGEISKEIEIIGLI